MLYETLKKLCTVSGVSGREQKVSKLIASMISPFVDSVRYDAMGSLIACKKGSAEAPKKVLFAAHTDEIGFFVNFIDDKGFIRFAPVGGINVSTILYSSVTFENGVKGVLLPDGKTEKEPKISTCYVDIGAADKKEAQRRVSVGDSFSLTGGISTITRNVWAGRPLDDRAGCAVLIEVIQKLEKPLDDIYFVFSTQEEVGCRGARTAAFGIMPDYGFSLDVTGTGDTPGAPFMAVRQGGGAAIKIKDSLVISNSVLVAAMLSLAEERKIPVQREIMERGGTDASAIQLAGVGAYVGGISIPSRGIHSGVETVDRRDLCACVDLISALCSVSLDALTQKER